MIKSLNKIMEESNPSVWSFRILNDSNCYIQVNDFIFEKIDYLVKKDEVYDGEIILKRNNQFYLDLGFDKALLNYIFIPIISENGTLLMERK